MYTATTTGQFIKIIDAKTGTTKKQVRFAGTLLQGPVVTQNELSITVRVNPTVTYALVYSLPSGVLRKKIRI